MKRLLVVLVIAIGVSAGVAAAQTPPAVQDAINTLKQAGAPGILVLLKNGSQTTVATAGVADPEANGAVVAGDHFRIGSITKTFVATVVLQLVAEGRLSLTDTVEKRLPGLVPNGKKITIRELLQHMSGLYDYTDDPRAFTPYLAGKLSYTWQPRQLVKIAVSHKPVYPPGTRWSYSNTNYVLLGLIVQAVTKDSLAGELTRRILKPLGLKNTSFVAGNHIPDPSAHGYYHGVDMAFLSGSVYWAAGAMVSTGGDLVRFLTGLFGGKLLRPQQLAAMEKTVPIGTNAYGLGVIKVATPCGVAWGHNGIIPGYSSWALSSRDGKRQAIVLATSRAFPEQPSYEDSINLLATTAFCS